MIVSLAGGAGFLQYVGPPGPHAPVVAEAPLSNPDISKPKAADIATPPVKLAETAPAKQPSEHKAEPVTSAPAAVVAQTATTPTQATTPVPALTPAEQLAEGAPMTQSAGSIAPPDPALLQPSNAYAGGKLPRIGPNHRMPMQAYAARFNASDSRPRIAILMAGIGMNEADSRAAASHLPAAVALAVTPYAAQLDALLADARAAGHELLVSIPMEPQGFPLNDPGNQALLTGASDAVNAQRLEWAMTRFTGYVGATGALGDMRGERFAAAANQMSPVLDTLAQRGLLYVDPRPNAMRLAPASQPGPARSVDIVIDDPQGAAEVEQKLARLEQIARDRGAAIGFAGRPSSVTVDRIAAWATGLDARGLALAPISVVVQMPQAPRPLTQALYVTTPLPGTKQQP